MSAEIRALIDEMTFLASDPACSSKPGALRRDDWARCVEQLCDAYESSDPATRVAIRAALRDPRPPAGKSMERRALLFEVEGFALEWSKQLCDTPGLTLLRRALLAVSMVDNGIDYRDSHSLVLNIARAAREAGLDPDPVLRHVAALSNTQFHEPEFALARVMLSAID